MTYNKDQWIASFEGQLAILRPHLTTRLLTTMSLAAWTEFGTAGEDPVEVARALSRLLDQGGAAASTSR